MPETDERCVPAEPVLYRVDEAGNAEPLGRRPEPLGPAGAAVVSALAAFVTHDRYPCVGAKAALAKGSCVLGVFSLDAGNDISTRCADADHALLDALGWFGASADRFDDGYATFLAVFDGVAIDSDATFERFLWERLQAVHDLDTAGWDRAVSCDPADPAFRFSAAGHGYFVIGLHPHAKREARRFPYPTLVFNLHRQFEKLRDEEKFARMRSVIRDREESLEGEPNPLLADHGTASEAHQYAGVAHRKGWKPPFRTHERSCPFVDARSTPAPPMHGRAAP